MSNQNVKDAIASGIIMRYSDGLLREEGNLSEAAKILTYNLGIFHPIK